MKLNYKQSKLPSTLTGPPNLALVPPGVCQFNETWQSVALLEKTTVSSTSAVFRFALPDVSKPLNLSTCACILAQADINGEAVVRPYTPISTNANVGFFDLLVKDYGEGAKMSRYMHNMKVGDVLNFKHTSFNVKIQAPFEYDEILMLVGGTGVNPMIQALHAMLGEKENPVMRAFKTMMRARKSRPVVTMLYGSQYSNEILGRDLLDKWAKADKKHFDLRHVVSRDAQDSDWKGRRGHITREMIEETSFPSATTDTSKKTLILVCGPPAFYDAMCGPREEKENVTGILGQMGYRPDQVCKL